MKDLSVAFQMKELRGGDAAVDANTSQIVALQVGDHHQFGDLFGRRLELKGLLLVLPRISVPRASPLDWTC